MSRVRNILITLVLLSLDLSASVSTASTQWAEANGVHLRYEISGRGPDTVVLLHEMSTSLESWDFVTPDIAHDHRVLRYDLRGFGLSERTHGPMTMNDEMEDLRGLLSALSIHGRVVIIGGAVGGAIALNFAAVHPDLVSGVIAISPAAYLARGGISANVGVTVSGATGANGTPSTSALDAAYPVALQQAHPDRIAHFRAIQATANHESAAATSAAANDVAFADILPKIQCPALIVATSQWIRPVASFKELADAIPHSEFVVIDTGHFAAIESPELVTPVLRQFLKRHRGALR